MPVGVVAVPIFIILSVGVLYNRLASLRNRVESGWAQIDVQLKRRNGLIPNLAAVAIRYMEHQEQSLPTLQPVQLHLSDGGGLLPVL